MLDANLPSCVIKHGWKVLESPGTNELNGAFAGWESHRFFAGIFHCEGYMGPMGSQKFMGFSKTNPDPKNRPTLSLGHVPLLSHPIPSNPIMILPSAYSWQEPPMENRWIRWLCLNMFFFLPRYFFIETTMIHHEQLGFSMVFPAFSGRGTMRSMKPGGRHGRTTSEALWDGQWKVARVGA